MRLAAPAAAFVWPICDFTLPMAHHGRARCADSPYTAVRAFASAASPTFVPVPCASTSSIVSGFTPALAYAVRRHRSCPAALGA